jgi:superfamily II helicase
MKKQQTIEEILGKYHLLEKKRIILGLTEISSSCKGSTIALTISHVGNMGDSLENVNENLKQITSLDNTLTMLDKLPSITSKEKGTPDYLWTKTYHYDKEAYIKF